MRSSGFDLVEAAAAGRGGQRRDNRRLARARRSPGPTRSSPCCRPGAMCSRAGPISCRRAASGALVIDCSTIDVESARRAHEAAPPRRRADASTRRFRAASAARPPGTLTFMCGGSDEAFARAKPILEAMGKRIVHCGGPGAGQAAKICNNMILGATMIATCEAFALAEKLGPFGAGAVRRRLDLVRPVLVADQLLPGSRAPFRLRPPTAAISRASPPA